MQCVDQVFITVMTCRHCLCVITYDVVKENHLCLPQTSINANDDGVPKVGEVVVVGAAIKQILENGD